MANLVKNEVVFIRLYDDGRPATLPTVADVVGSMGIQISLEGLGLQEFNWPREAETRENTGRNGYIRRESQGVIDHSIDFQVDWVSETAPLNTDGLLDAETKYMAIVRRPLGTASGRTQVLGGGIITAANLVDRDGGWAFDVTVEGDDAITRSNQ